MSVTPSPILVALDYSNLDDALRFVDRIDPAQCRLKVGKEMFTLFGPSVVRTLQARGFDLFLDLKFHDIPNTTAHAVAAAAELGVWMVNVHASGGARMMQAAREALLPFGKDAPLLIASRNSVAWMASSAQRMKRSHLNRRSAASLRWSRPVSDRQAATRAISAVL